MIQLKNITLRRGLKVLLENTSININRGEKVGIVGSNGAGKSSLFQLILGTLETDKGACDIPKTVTISQIRQEIPHGAQSILSYVLSGDAQLSAIISGLEEAEKQGDGIAIAEYHHQLATIDGYTAESRAAKIIVGLGFVDKDLHRPLDDFSGGWRMRLNLAQVLMSPSDLLLLDEPTNHLDMEAIYWIEEWIRKMNKTILIISHDREFLDNVVRSIVFIKHQSLLSYTGNYSDFESQYAMQLEQQQAMHEKQQRQIGHMMKFVDRFRYRASKAKQAQSRLKMIERIDRVAAVHQQNPFNFRFKDAPLAGNPMLSLNKVSIGYDDEPVLKDVSLSIRPGDRMAFIGVNGAGKSTLIKALAQKLSIDGEATFNSKIRIGYFTQHQVDSLEFSQSAMWHLQNLDSKVSEQVARQYLGGFNFKDDRVFEPVKNFSGGEKARLALALLVWQQPNLLLLDEPSNHFDLEMRQALAIALQSYEGALLLISHDRYLLNTLINEFYLISDGKVEAFSGTLDDYHTWYEKRKIENREKTGAKAVKTKSKETDWEIELDKKELILSQEQNTLKEIDEKLADAKIYQDSSRAKELQNYLQQQKVQKDKIASLESEIIEMIDNL